MSSSFERFLSILAIFRTNQAGNLGSQAEANSVDEAVVALNMDTVSTVADASDAMASVDSHSFPQCRDKRIAESSGNSEVVLPIGCIVQSLSVTHQLPAQLSTRRGRRIAEASLHE